MNLTYIFHSGFVVETEQVIMVFDYWMDPADVMSRFLNSGKPLYVFSSHFHEDHFNRTVFEWKKTGRKARQKIQGAFQCQVCARDACCRRPR